MIDLHLKRLRARDDISADEERALRDAVADVRDLPSQRVAVRAGEELSQSLILMDGLMCRFKDLRDGDRQICELHIPGDFPDLHSFTLKRLDHNLLALTACRVAIVPHERLARITRDFPHLTRVYWSMTNMDAAIHREWVLSLGRRTASQRMANLFCELHVRMGVVGLARGDEYDLPVTQATLAEALGLTPVHVNRTLKELREAGLLSFRSGRVKLIDRAGLVRAAEFDPSYLYLEKRDR